MPLSVAQLLKPVGGVDWTEYFGNSVHSDGDILAVGQPIHDIGAFMAAGAASVWRYVSGTWVHQQTLEPPVADHQNLLYFGLCVRVSGDTLAVSAPGALVGGSAQAGAVYVYRTADGGATWALEQKIVQAVPSANYRFGASLAITGNVLAIAYQSDVPLANCGAVDVWDRVGAVWAYTETVQATAPLANSYFGCDGSSDSSIALLNGVLAVCSNPSGGNASALHIFRRAGIFAPEQKLDNPTSPTHDLISVALKTDLIVCGDPDLDGGANNSGGFHVARRAGGVWSWTQVEGCPAAFDVPNAFAGWSVCLSTDGSYLMVGAVGAKIPTDPGGIYGACFLYQSTGGAFTFVDYGYPAIIAYVGGSGIGWHSSSAFLVGARDYDFDVDGQGAVLVYLIINYVSGAGQAAGIGAVRGSGVKSFMESCTQSPPPGNYSPYIPLLTSADRQVPGSPRTECARSVESLGLMPLECKRVMHRVFQAEIKKIQQYQDPEYRAYAMEQLGFRLGQIRRFYAARTQQKSHNR